MSSDGTILLKAVALVAVGTAIGMTDSAIRPVRLSLPVSPPRGEAAPGPGGGPATPLPSPAAGSGATPGTPDQPASAVPDAPPTAPQSDLPDGHITVDRAWELFQEGAAFIDARAEQTEFESGHVQGALFLPLSVLRKRGAEAIASLKERVNVLQPVVVYCGGGDCEASMDVALVLFEEGYTDVSVLHDGYPGWAAAGHPTETGLPEEGAP